MRKHRTFDERATAGLRQLTAAEAKVVRYFREHREDVMVASAAALASRIGTSDASVIRAVRALGYRGLDDLRQNFAAEIRQDLSPASRMSRTLGEISEDANSALDMVLEIHEKGLKDLKRDVSSALFHSAVKNIATAARVVVFGLGPSSAMADYLTIQLNRFGLDSFSLTHSGLLLADGLRRLKERDLIIILAYGRVYPELDALLGRASALGLSRISRHRHARTSVAQTRRSNLTCRTRTCGSGKHAHCNACLV